ncbi:MAG: GntR family transcriptional regulator [Ktedonobacterales bacterium]
MPLPQEVVAVSRVCLRDEAYARLRDWIIDGTLAPEESLRDEALAEALGMSRTPVREALQRLEDEGLVVTVATRRTYVSPVTLIQAREIYPIVASLESLAVRFALPHIDATTLDRMAEANRRLALALEACDTGEAVEADTSFHAAFIERNGNHELMALLDDLKSKVRRIDRTFWGTSDRSDSLRDHDELIAAFRAHDSRTAQRVLARNWERGLNWLNPASTPHMPHTSHAPQAIQTAS